MTTDTRPKLAARGASSASARCGCTGIAKGAGMIHPNMATMLAPSSPTPQWRSPSCEQALQRSRQTSASTASAIDGDTSTNDTVLLLANGAAEHAEIVDAESPAVRGVPGDA